MQVRALMEAAVERVAAGGNPIVEIMIPLTISREEMALARSWVEGAIEEVAAAGGAASGGRGRGRARAGALDVTIGTMIEVPRAALQADGVAEYADFFSFGTNDLTQMTLGFSRDDIEGRIMASYVENGLLKANPFESIDTEGVGQLVRLAAERGRAAKPGLKLGVCGEHGGDPDSIAFFYDAGLDYVSCSPFRVPIARLAAAQAVLGAGSSDTR
jgi:pyruvate,orthophosphate dikinase